MMNNDDIDNIRAMKKYLLGMTSEAEREQIEKRFFWDNIYFEQLQNTEDQLIEEYLGEQLTPKEKTNFESYFMQSRERQKDVAQAGLLRDYFFEELIKDDEFVEGAKAAKKPNWFNLDWLSIRKFAVPSFVFSLLLLIAGFALWINNYPPPKQIEGRNIGEQAIRPIITTGSETNSPSETASRQKVLPPLAPNKNQNDKRELAKTNQSEADREDSNLSREKRPPQLNLKNSDDPLLSRNETKRSVVNLALVGGQTMSAGDNKSGVVGLTPDSQSLRLQLYLESASYSAYQAELRTEGDQIVWQQNHLEPPESAANKKIFITVPAQVLTAQIYKVVLSGANRNGAPERIRTYYFRVERK